VSQEPAPINRVASNTGRFNIATTSNVNIQTAANFNLDATLKIDTDSGANTEITSQQFLDMDSQQDTHIDTPTKFLVGNSVKPGNIDQRAGRIDLNP